MSQIDLLNSISYISYELQILIIALSKITAKTTEREFHSEKRPPIDEDFDFEGVERTFLRLVSGLHFIIIRSNHGKIFYLFSYELRCQCMMMILSSSVKTFYYLANFAVSNWFEIRMI